MDLAEYFIDEQDAREWLPWGGIVRPAIVRNKDYSFFGVISYGRPLPEIPPLELPKGWSLWSEEQHRQGETKFFLVVAWNPFWSTLGDESENALKGRRVPRRKAPDYFAEELARISELVRKADPACRVLEYQEIVDFLSFSLSFGENHIEMPDIPLYLDVALTEGLDIDFEENDIFILGKTLVVLSLPSCPRGGLLDEIRGAFIDIPYRYVRRTLSMSEREAETEMKEYTKGWCSSRGYMRRAVMDGVFLPMSGYYSEELIFSLPEDTYGVSIRYVRQVMENLCVPYILESFNLKDVWWGSLAGCFRANIRPLITGFGSLGDFLIQPSEERGVASV